MQSARTPIVKDLVLVGGGHSHVAVLRSFGMNPLPGVRLTLVTRDVHTPYSGMLPGLVAGHYEFDEIHIDLQKLARFAQARLIHAEVVGVDVVERKLRFDDRPELSYDLLAINTGSTPGYGGAVGAEGRVTPVKPISGFVPFWEGVVERTLAARGAVRIGVVGAGAGGVELTLAMQQRLDGLLANVGSTHRPEFHLFNSASTVLPTHNSLARAKFERVLGDRGVRVHRGVRIVQVDDEGVRDQDGTFYPLDEIFWTTQASAPPWPHEAGLQVDEAGFIEVDEMLRSVSRPDVFATGDVATMAGHRREKAGVFAVRQGPPLARNLRLVLKGEQPEPFRPQKDFLSLISTGDRYAVASRSIWSFEGEWVWKWKDWIDRRFMDKYGAELPAMKVEEPETPAGMSREEAARQLGELSMRCAGCGSKVGSTALGRALERVRARDHPDVLIGVRDADDAAVLRIPAGKDLVQTVDFFRAMVEDPYVFGQITAHHCLGDIFAMGAAPHSALATAVVPYALEAKVEESLAQLLSGAEGVLHEAGAALIGGHSTEGDALALGLSINGLVDPGEALGKGGARAGDRWILTKPIGTGVLFAAEMWGRAKGRWVEEAIERMLTSNQQASRILRRRGANACTDVTGFGLAGHLLEMLRASGLGGSIRLGAVPLLAGARESAAGGIGSSLLPSNAKARHAIRAADGAEQTPEWPLLFDPQTAGGLLAAIPVDQAEECLEELLAAGYGGASLIGEAVEADGDQPPLAVGA